MMLASSLTDLEMSHWHPLSVMSFLPKFKSFFIVLEALEDGLDSSRKGTLRSNDAKIISDFEFCKSRT